jgi:hypothetical protein
MWHYMFRSVVRFSVQSGSGPCVGAKHKLKYDSSVGVVTKPWTNDRGIVVPFTVKTLDFYILQTLQTSMSTGVAFTGGKAAGE